jgi:tRNA(Ile)-lysidine synthase
MKVDLAPGRYIVAVSGGVDSVVLLDLLRKIPSLRVIVAHVNHGVRADSGEDEKLVAGYAKQYGLKYEVTHLHLKPNVSEAEAREKRYAFLRKLSENYNADGIVTAHHQDDLLETALLALIRGTGWRGLAPFAIDGDIKRPLLSFRKQELIAYAKQNNLLWHEDSTNADERYLRNKIRQNLVPHFNKQDPSWRGKVLELVAKQQELRSVIEKSLNEALSDLIVRSDKSITARRYSFIMLPDPVAYELLQELFRQTWGNSLLRPQTEAALLFIKVARSGKKMDLNKIWQLRVTTDKFVVAPTVTVVS